MNQSQWVPAIVLLGVGILIGGASVFRTIANEQPEATALVPEGTPPPKANLRRIPEPPPISEPDQNFQVATPGAAVIDLPEGNEAAGAATAELDNTP